MIIVNHPPCCNNRIPLVHGRAETYCILDLGHPGKCVPDASIKGRYPDRKVDESGQHKKDGEK